MPPREFRILPATSRRHGLPPIGFTLSAPDCVQVTLLDPSEGKSLLLGTERASDGRILGEAAVDVFTASLVIDPDRALDRVVQSAADRLLAPPAQGERGRSDPLELDDGTFGRRLEVTLTRARDNTRPTLPHISLLALASPDPSARGGLLLTLRTAQPSWEPATLILESLRLLTRDGANDNSRSSLPFVRR